LCEYITPEDKGFLKSLIHDNSSSNELLFSHLKGSTRANGFISKDKYLPETTIFKNTNMLNTSVTTEHSFEKVLYNLIPLFSKRKITSDKISNSFEYIKEQSPEEIKDNYGINSKFPLIYLESDIIFNFGLLENRKLMDITTIEYDSQSKTLYYFMKPCNFNFLHKI
jgi:hypothetical protein